VQVRGAIEPLAQEAVIAREVLRNGGRAHSLEVRRRVQTHTKTNNQQPTTNNQQPTTNTYEDLDVVRIVPQFTPDQFADLKSQIQAQGKIK
jgi:hypothetical protein